MIETVRADQWIYATLTADAALAAVVAGRVFADVAPPDAALPAVVFTEQAVTTDVTSHDGNRILLEAVYLVRAVTEATSWHGDLKTCADRIDAVLHGASGTSGGVTVADCTREQPFRQLDPADGRQYRHLGGMYRLTLYT